MKETQHTRDVKLVRGWLEVRSQHAKDAFERIVRDAETSRSNYGWGVYLASGWMLTLGLIAVDIFACDIFQSLILGECV